MTAVGFWICWQSQCIVGAQMERQYHLFKQYTSIFGEFDLDGLDGDSGCGGQTSYRSCAVDEPKEVIMISVVENLTQGKHTFSTFR